MTFDRGAWKVSGGRNCLGGPRSSNGRSSKVTTRPVVTTVTRTDSSHAKSTSCSEGSTGGGFGPTPSVCAATTTECCGTTRWRAGARYPAGAVIGNTTATSVRGSGSTCGIIYPSGVLLVRLMVFALVYSRKRSPARAGEPARFKPPFHLMVPQQRRARPHKG